MALHWIFIIQRTAGGTTGKINIGNGTKESKQLIMSLAHFGYGVQEVTSIFTTEIKSRRI